MSDAPKNVSSQEKCPPPKDKMTDPYVSFPYYYHLYVIILVILYVYLYKLGTYICRL